MGIAAKVGMRIRYYRTLRKFSLQTLSKLVHKSVSTLSKYESGQIAVDVDTLYEIAATLSISVHQLLDEPPVPPVLRPGQPEQHFFLKTAPIYVYYMTSQTIALSVLVPTGQEDSVLDCSVFMEANSAEDYSMSRYFFHAKIHCFDSGAAIFLQNPINGSDHGFMYVKLPFSSTAPIVGLFTYSSDKIRMPATVKVLFSDSPITRRDYLMEKLSSNNKLTLSELKKKNVFLPW